MGSPYPFSTVPCVHRRESQLLQIVLDDVDPSFPLSTSTPFSIEICLQDSLATVVVFSPLRSLNYYYKCVFVYRNVRKQKKILLRDQQLSDVTT